MIFATRYADSAVDYLIYLIFTLVAVCIALVLHEVAHGLVAKWNGDYTAKYSGRLSLNPLKHFDLIGFIMMMLVGFGYAKPVPVNPNNFKHYRRGAYNGRNRGRYNELDFGVCVGHAVVFDVVRVQKRDVRGCERRRYKFVFVPYELFCYIHVDQFIACVFLIFCLFFRSTDFASWKRSLAAATGFARLCATNGTVYTLGTWWIELYSFHGV